MSYGKKRLVGRKQLVVNFDINMTHITEDFSEKNGNL